MKKLLKDLNSIDEIHLKVAREILSEAGFFKANSYLRSVTEDEDHPFLLTFINEVVKGGRPCEKWMRHDGFYILLELFELLSLPVENWPIFYCDQNPIIQIQPTEEYWHSKSIRCGVLGVLGVLDKSLN